MNHRVRKIISIISLWYEHRYSSNNILTKSMGMNYHRNRNTNTNSMGMT